MPDIPVSPLYLCLVAAFAFVVLPLGILLERPREITRRLRRDLGAEALPEAVFAGFFLLWVVLSALLFGGLISSLFDLVSELVLTDSADRSEKAKVNFRFFLAGIAALTATLGATLAIPFTLIRIRHSQEANFTAQQGLITDRINSAVESLGRDKTTVRQITDKKGKPTYEKDDKRKNNFSRPAMIEVTPPNIEVRIGAVLALERIAKENLDFHIQIMEILTAYVRLNAPAGPMNATLDLSERPRIREDIQLCITVLGRRSDLGKQQELAQKFRLNLSECDLRGADFSKGDFTAAIFTASNAEAALFAECTLRGALITRSQLSYADFFNANLTGADLQQSTIEIANTYALQHASSIRGINLCGADISGIDYLGENEILAGTFGSSDTKLHEEYEGIRKEFNHRKALSTIRIAKRKNETEKLKELEASLNAYPFKSWSPYTRNDMATKSEYRKFLDHLGLTGFPFFDR